VGAGERHGQAASGGGRGGAGIGVASVNVKALVVVGLGAAGLRPCTDFLDDSVLRASVRRFAQRGGVVGNGPPAPSSVHTPARPPLCIPYLPPPSEAAQISPNSPADSHALSWCW
jgi:hypothetical protein